MSNRDPFPGKIYAPPAVYTEVITEPSTAATPDLNRVPTYIGTGNEILSVEGQDLIRGSSGRVDQEISDEDVSGRLVLEVTPGGQVILGVFDGTGSRVQVKHYPIVDGSGTGTVTNDRSRVAATINGEQVVVLAVDGQRGFVTLASSIDVNDEVRISYFFKRRDTQLTDDVSAQVTEGPAILDGEIGIAPSETYSIIANFNDILLITVDELTESTITLPEGEYSPSQIAAILTGEAIGTLTSTAFSNSEGDIALRLRSDHFLQIGNGSANGVFGFVSGDRTSRNKTFFVFNGPIVDGTNGGVTTTDPTKVSVLVNGSPATVAAVNGSARSIQLVSAPADGDTVTITYYINTWQDTFDYLPNVNVTEIVRSGLTPNRKDYVEGIDFILRDDLIIWGSATVVTSETTTDGFSSFGASQVTSTLVDQREYMSACTSVVDTSVSPPVQSRKDFLLPFTPTTGNGRNTPLSPTLFDSISNNRQDLATSRPDLITAFWGYSLQDAIDRGPVPVAVVNSGTRVITLKDPVPTGASVWATLYYNSLTDGQYLLTTVIPGATGVGVYNITDPSGNTVYNVKLGTKSPALTGVTLNFPRGSEFYPEARMEPLANSSYEGPVDEVVTVTFAQTSDSPAKYAVSGPGPYYFVGTASDKMRLTVDGASLASGATGINLTNPTGVGCGFFASILGSEVVYDSSTGGATYTIETQDADLSVNVDGVIINSTATVGAGATVQEYADALNAAATAGGSVAPKYKGSTRFTSPLVVTASQYDRLNFYFTGDVVGGSGLQTITLAPGTYNSVNTLVSQINLQIAALTGPVASTGSFTLAVPLVGETVTVDGVLFTGVLAPRTPGANDFDVRPLTQATATVTVNVPLALDTLTIQNLPTPASVLTGIAGARTSGSNNFDARPLTQATGTITIVTPAALETITIGGTLLTAVNGAPGVDEFDMSSADPNTIAGNIAAAINNGANSFTTIVTAGALLDVVTVTAVPVGALGNAVTLVSSDGINLAVSGANLTGGINADAAAQSIVDAINDGLNSFGALVTASRIGLIITLTAVPVGTLGNALTLVTNAAPRLVLGSGTLTGGVSTNDDAASLTAALNDATNWAGPAPVTAVQAGAVVNMSASIPGVAGDSITIVSGTAQIVASGPTLTGGVDGLSGTVTVSADSSGRLVFALTSGLLNNSGYLEFITDAVPARDFAILAGIDTAAIGTTQTKLYDGPIATVFTVGSAPLQYDRLILRNRILPGSGSIAPYHSVSQTLLRVLGSGSSTKIGLVSQQSGTAGYQAVIQRPSLAGNVGFAGGQATGNGDARDGQPVVVFYNGTGISPANDVLKFTMDNTSVTVPFTSSLSGTATPLGPISVAGTVLNQIAASMAVSGFGGGVTATVISQGLIRQEGAGFRITSLKTDQFGSVLVGSGSANVVLGLQESESAFRTSVSTKTLASALMANAQAAGNLADWILDPNNVAATYFAGEALAGVVVDAVGAEYLYLQSRTLGTTSSILFSNPTASSVLLPGTRLIDSVGDGAVGEGGVSGYFVTSTDGANGSGSINTSIFNSGVGQDGFVGQTYRDAVTGMTFALLPRDGGSPYPVGGSFTFVVSPNVSTNGNIPIVAIPGVEVLVTSTAGTNVGDQASVENFEKSGSEPEIGQIYYVSYKYRKADYQHRLFTRLSTIQNTYGALSPDNPVTLAAYLAFLNGASIVGIKQVPKNPSTGVASIQEYEDALVQLEQPFEGGVLPTILTPLTGGISDLNFFKELSKHLDIQSSIRYKKERTAIIGVSPITTPDSVITIATTLQNERMVLVYPDSVVLQIPNNVGGNDDYLVQGFYLAAALAGSASSSTTDVATPLTKRIIKGFKETGRKLNDDTANRIAQNGVLIMEEENGNIVVRHELTTRMDTINTQLPTITWISDEVQKRARVSLRQFIGTKFLSDVTGKISSKLNGMYDQMKKEELIVDHRGVKTEVDANNPTIARSESFFKPVYPLLYIVARFNLRTNTL